MALIAPDRYFNWSPSSGVSEYDYEIINTATGVVLRSGVVYTSSSIYTYAQAKGDGAVIASITIRIRAKDLASGDVGTWFESVIATPFPETDLAAHSHTLADISDAGTMAGENVGATGSFTTADGKTITVSKGVITGIV